MRPTQSNLLSLGRTRTDLKVFAGCVLALLFFPLAVRIVSSAWLQWKKCAGFTLPTLNYSWLRFHNTKCMCVSNHGCQVMKEAIQLVLSSPAPIRLLQLKNPAQIIWETGTNLPLQEGYMLFSRNSWQNRNMSLEACFSFPFLSLTSKRLLSKQSTLLFG